jgi:type I site-specific restriction endonuclease
MAKPEDKAREDIDRMLEKADWDVQDIDHTNIYARQGVAIRNFPLKPGHGFADYVLYIDGKAAGVIEAKKARGYINRRRDSIGLTATPNKQSFGFFNQNLVMEYPHEQAVADGKETYGISGKASSGCGSGEY